MRDRIRPPRDLESVLDHFKDQDVFETKQKGMMFAASVGFAIDAFEPPESTGEGIRLEYFSRQNDAGFIDAVAVAHVGNLDVLADDRTEERFEIFEAFAAGGLAEMQRRLDKDKTRTELDVVIDLLEDLREARGDRVKQLKGLL